MPRKVRKPRPRERAVQALMKAWLESRGCRVFRRNVALVRTRDGRYMRIEKPGRADLYGVLPDGRYFELEVKRPGERPTPDQVAFLMEMNGRGANRAVAFWADSLGVVETVFRGVMNGQRVVYLFGRKYEPGDYCLEPER